MELFPLENDKEINLQKNAKTLKTLELEFVFANIVHFLIFISFASTINSLDLNKIIIDKFQSEQNELIKLAILIKFLRFFL